MNNSRLGISASKKFGNAVKRNHFKRIVREFFRVSDIVNLSFDIIIVANTRFLPLKSKITDTNRTQYRKDLSKLFNEIQLKS